VRQMPQGACPAIDFLVGYFVACGICRTFVSKIAPDGPLVRAQSACNGAIGCLALKLFDPPREFLTFVGIEPERAFLPNIAEKSVDVGIARAADPTCQFPVAIRDAGSP
jgi:hypothetical protein